MDAAGRAWSHDHEVSPLAYGGSMLLSGQCLLLVLKTTGDVHLSVYRGVYGRAAFTTSAPMVSKFAILRLPAAGVSAATLSAVVLLCLLIDLFLLLSAIRCVKDVCKIC